MSEKVSKGSFYIFLSQAGVFILGAVSVFFLARVLGPDKYGQYSVIFAFCLIFQAFFESGFTGSAIKTIASEKEDIYSLSKFAFLSQTIWTACIFLVVFLGAPLWVKYIFKDQSIVIPLRIASLYFIPMAVFLIARCILIAQNKFTLSALMMFLWSVARILVVIPFLFLWKSVNSVFWAIAISSLIGLFGIKLATKDIEKKKTFINKKHVVAIAFSLIVSAVGVRALFQIDKLFVKNILQKDNIVGLYALASNFALTLQLFSAPLIITLFPSVAASFKQQNTKLTHDYLWLGSRYFLLLLVPVSFGLNFIGKDIIQLIFGSQYIGSASPFKILIFAAACFSFFLLYRQLMVAMNRYKESVFITCTVLIAALVLNPLLINKYGVMGAALTTLIASFVGAVLSGIYVFRLAKAKYPWSSLVKIFIATVTCYYLATLGSGLNLMLRYSLFLALGGLLLIFLVVSREITKEDLKLIKGIFSFRTTQAKD